jgi:hypothetical protein
MMYSEFKLRGDNLLLIPIFELITFVLKFPGASEKAFCFAYYQLIRKMDKNSVPF